MLERMAAELELSTQTTECATVDLSTAATLSGFSRAHLRRLIREGKLATTADGALVRVSDLPRKPGAPPTGAAPPPWTSSGREAISELLALK